jgi:phosphoglycolate phosphatase-like HAD superfamily hydrolase
LSAAFRHVALDGVASLTFLDFDGVVKDSVDAKGAAFIAIFREFGEALGERILAHHRSNGGMSRAQKIPLYLSWAGLPARPGTVEAFTRSFAVEARRAVIESPWVPGALEFLKRQQAGKVKVIVSATPEEELRSIAEELDILRYVESAIGTPTTKIEAIRSTMIRLNARPIDCTMVGDSKVDLEAAVANGVPFILRRHEGNRDLEPGNQGRSIRDLRDL